MHEATIRESLESNNDVILAKEIKFHKKTWKFQAQN